MSAVPREPLVDPIVWIDMEMTGLDPETEYIVEIGVIVTDGQLETLIEGPDLVIHQPQEVLDAMDPFVIDMHRTSGLDVEIAASRLTTREAEVLVLEWLKTHVGQARIAPLGGNSVHNDRAFMVKHMPELEAYVHYRNIDVSTLKELFKRWNPALVEGAPAKVGGHRALGDIKDSINELLHYRTHGMTC